MGNLTQPQPSSALAANLLYRLFLVGGPAASRRLPRKPLKALRTRALETATNHSMEGVKLQLDGV